MKNSLILFISFFLFYEIGYGQYAHEKDKQILPDTIYSIAEIMPLFIGGTVEFNSIVNQLKYPLYAKQNRIYGNVETEIAVDTNGNVIQVDILKGLGYGCDEEAERLIYLTSGKWTAAEKWGKKAAVKFSLTISFKPESDNLDEKSKNLFKQGLKIYNNKNYENALTFFKSATEFSPNYIDAHFYSGNCYFNLNKKEEACAAWNKSIELGLVKNEKDKLIDYCMEKNSTEQTVTNVTPQKLVTIDSTLYSKDFKFKDGAYRIFDEFRFNSPSLKYMYRENVKKDELNLFVEKDTNVILYSWDGSLENKLKRKNIWGYCKDGKVFVLGDPDLIEKDFFTLDIIGGMTLTSCDVIRYNGGVDDGRAINLATGNVSEGTNNISVNGFVTSGYTTHKAKLRIIDTEDGELKLYNVANFMEILKRDEKLFEEYSTIKGDKKKKDMMFIYLKKFNNNHPLYLLNSTYE